MYQNTVIVGNLTRDPEMRYTPNGVAVTTFTVAVNKRYKGKDGEAKEKTTYFRVTAWNKLAEITNQYLAKGRQVLVEGEVSASAYKGQDGEPKASLEITAREVKFLGGKGNGSNDNGQAEAAPAASPSAEDDLPF